MTASDVEYNTNILFNMPSLTQIPFDYYSAKAAVYTAEKTLEMKKRELVARLYQHCLLYTSIIFPFRGSFVPWTLFLRRQRQQR